MSTKKRNSNKHSIPAGFEHVRSYKGIQEYILKKNGLRVLFNRDRRAPVVGVMVTYLVGSRNEVTGNTGSTHILEHLMFKGSKKFPPKRGVSALDTLSKKGALVNASTWLDRTNYYEVLPKEHFEFAISLEADRMRNAIISKRDLEEELPAVMSEYAMYDNEPVEHLDEKVWATAFLAHPYHHSTIGWYTDIENTTAEKLKDFYDTYYHPNNAVVTVIGDVERNDALNTIKKHFGVHKASSWAIPNPNTKEPEQTGPRLIEVQRKGTQNVVTVAFKVPDGLDTDTPSILMLDAILGGGKNSRLYKGLVEKGFASSVWTFYRPFIDPSLIKVSAIPVEGVTHGALHEEIIAICEHVKKGITKTELKQVREQTITSIMFMRDTHFSTLSALNEAISIGDWRYFIDIPNKLEKVQAKDVQQVAKKYLVSEGKTVGFYKALS